MSIVHPDWTTSRAVPYDQDLRAPGGATKTWNLTITSPKPNDNVTISWSDIAATVPKDWRLTLIDPSTSSRRALQSTSSYVINTGASATRSIQIVAVPGRSAGRLQILTFDVVPGAVSPGRAAPTNVTINYSFNNSADAQVNIRNASGRTLRTLVTSTRAVPTGSATEGSAVWDMRDSHGVALPSGLYSVELVALTQDGQQSRQIKPYLLTR
jgi:hypothetical protein